MDEGDGDEDDVDDDDDVPRHNKRRHDGKLKPATDLVNGVRLYSSSFPDAQLIFSRTITIAFLYHNRQISPSMASEISQAGLLSIPRTSEACVTTAANVPESEFTLMSTLVRPRMTPQMDMVTDIPRQTPLVLTVTAGQLEATLTIHRHNTMEEVASTHPSSPKTLLKLLSCQLNRPAAHREGTILLRIAIQLRGLTIRQCIQTC